MDYGRNSTHRISRVSFNSDIGATDLRFLMTTSKEQVGRVGYKITFAKDKIYLIDLLIKLIGTLLIDRISFYKERLI